MLQLAWHIAVTPASRSITRGRYLAKAEIRYLGRLFAMELGEHIKSNGAIAIDS